MSDLVVFNLLGLFPDKPLHQTTKMGVEHTQIIKKFFN